MCIADCPRNGGVYRALRGTGPVFDGKGNPCDGRRPSGTRRECGGGRRIWIFLRPGSGHGRGQGCAPPEKADTGEVSGNSLSDSGTQHGLLYHSQLPVPLWNGNPGCRDLRHRIPAGGACECMQGHGGGSGLPFWTKTHGEAYRQTCIWEL